MAEEGQPLRLVLRILGIVLALFLAYVVGRAAGILLGIGPYLTEALAIAAVLAFVVIGSRRRRRSAGFTRP